MTNLPLSPLRRAVVLAAITGVAAFSPVAGANATAKKAPKQAPAADLVVKNLEVEFAGETLQVFADVTNAGSKQAQRRSSAVVAISGDETFDENDDVLDETSVRRLRGGRTYELETEVDVPADEDLPDGDVYLLVCADGDNVVREKNEHNNCSAELIASEDDAVSDDDDATEEDSSADEDGSEDFPVTDER